MNQILLTKNKPVKHQIVSECSKKESIQKYKKLLLWHTLSASILCVARKITLTIFHLPKSEGGPAISCGCFAANIFPRRATDCEGQQSPVAAGDLIRGWKRGSTRSSSPLDGKAVPDRKSFARIRLLERMET
ncbi:hypothetical protein CDAR_289671 [Caerostris darwini]|uniref:Uncharacterized protein n=1 Tax=Caerostris darwini TaxID=1538125 RepID=A0AAV4WVX8_9ARAC|nr:hypothetical protein CDAR_289671 [Caerostris darwini]